MSLYTMKLSDSVDTMEFNLLEVPIQDKDIEGAVDNVVLSGDIYTDFLWLKKRFTHKWSILCKDDYERLRGFYTRQFSNAEVPIYQLLDAPSPIEESAGSGEYIQITTTDSTAKLASVEMLGKAEQTTYSGKNLARPNANYTSAGISFVWNSDGTLTLNGTATNAVDVWVANGGSGAAEFTIPTGTKLTQSFRVVSGSASANTWAVRTIPYYGGSTHWGDIVGNATFTASSETQIRGLEVLTPSGLTFNSLRLEIQLEESATATAWEPYVGRTASPNPDYPQPISVATGENTVKIEGKNLLNISSPTRTFTRYGVTITLADDGLITLNGTATGNQWPDLIYGIGANTIAHSTTATSYEESDVVMSAKVVGGTATGTGNAGTSVYCNDDGSKTMLIKYTDMGATPTATATYGINRAFMYIPNGAVFNNYSFYLMVEKGSTASSFEPYQGQEFEVNLGKNLAPNNATSQTMRQVVFTKNDDGSITANGTADSTAFYPVTDNFWLEAGTYTLSSTNQCTTTAYLQLVEVATGSPVLTNLNNTKSSSFTITNGKTARLYYRIASGAQVNLTVFPQLERGTLATTYAPYFTPIELAKIGNYQDRIYKDNGKWYIEKQVGKVVLDGTENWVARGTQYTGYLGVYETSKQFGMTSNFLDPAYFMCDHFKSGNGTYNATYGQNISSTQYAIYITIDSSITADVTAFKTWLSTHPTTVYYALATPTTTEITNEALIAQLDALGASSLYIGANNIGTETPNAMPTLALTYFPYYPHEIISPKAVRMELTDGGIINACECRENVQITLRETIQ